MDTYAEVESLVRDIESFGQTETADPKSDIFQRISLLNLKTLSMEKISLGTYNNNNDKGRCCTELMFKLNEEERSRPFQEQFPETNLSMEQMQELAKALLITTRSHNESISTIKKKESKHDRKLEELINNAVAKYFKGTVILSGYKYKTADSQTANLMV